MKKLVTPQEGDETRVVVLDGRPHWQIGDWIAPVISGGSEDNGDDDDGGDDSTGDDDGDGSDDTDDGSDGGDDLDPEAMRSELARARREAAKYRRERKAAEEARKEFEARVAKALGIDSGDDADGDQLSQRLAERDAEVRELRIDAAITKAVAKHTADEDLLVPWLKGKGLLADLDPESESFTDDLDELVKETVKANPRFRISQEDDRVRGSGDGGTAGRPGGKDPSSLSPSEYIAQRRKRRQGG